MNNKAYEQYQATQPAVHHEPPMIDPFDGEITGVEIGVCIVFVLAIVWAIYTACFTDNKKNKGEQNE
jgi:hypothetical protein